MTPSIAALQQALEALEEFDHGLSQWAQAYPVDVFPEPDFAKVRTMLGDNLLTCVSAENMRHVVTKLDAEFAPVRAALSSLRAAVKDTAEGEVRMLTDGEVADAIKSLEFDDTEFVVIQRKFCEVNGLRLPPPPKENAALSTSTRTQHEQ